MSFDGGSSETNWSMGIDFIINDCLIKTYQKIIQWIVTNEYINLNSWQFLD